jgi:hypothetical protein
MNENRRLLRWPFATDLRLAHLAERAHFNLHRLPAKRLLGKTGGDARTLAASYFVADGEGNPEELNLARTDPQRYATLLEEARKNTLRQSD